VHANYFFYVPTWDIDEAISAFESWADENCDENNWWMLLYAVNDRGERRVLAEEGDWRGRDEYAREKVAQKPTVETVWKEAWLSCAWEVDFSEEERKELAEKRLNDIAPFFLVKLLEKIREMYNELLPKLICGETLNDYEHVLRKRRTRYFEEIFEIYRTSYGKPPFVFYGTPYEFRAFDLSFYLDEKKNGTTILVVDIHT